MIVTKILNKSREGAAAQDSGKDYSTHWSFLGQLGTQQRSKVLFLAQWGQCCKLNKSHQNCPWWSFLIHPRGSTFHFIRFWYICTFQTLPPTYAFPKFVGWFIWSPLSIFHSWSSVARGLSTDLAQYKQSNVHSIIFLCPKIYNMWYEPVSGTVWLAPPPLSPLSPALSAGSRVSTF